MGVVEFMRKWETCARFHTFVTRMYFDHLLLCNSSILIMVNIII